MRAAQLQGLPVARLIILACLLGGACAGLAGTIEVAAEYGRANASLNAGYGYTGILIAFLARFNPLAIMPMAVLLGGLGAAGGLMQRRMDLPDATVQVLQGMIFVAILTSDTLYGRIKWFQPRGGRVSAAPCRATPPNHGPLRGPSPQGKRRGDPRMTPVATVAVAMLAGSLRVSTPFLFVSIGECLTEKSGRINLGNEGVLVLGAMVGLRHLLRNRQSLARRARRRRSPACCSAACTARCVRSRASTTWPWASPSCSPAPASRSSSASRSCSPARRCCPASRSASGPGSQSCTTR